MVAAGRHDELFELLDTAPYESWNHRQYGVAALVAQDRPLAAVRYAENHRGLNDDTQYIARKLEALLIAAGRSKEAYKNYAISANESRTYTAWF